MNYNNMFIKIDREIREETVGYMQRDRDGKRVRNIKASGQAIPVRQR